SSFLRVGRKKQNKFPSNLHCFVKKLNPFLFSIYHYRICLLVCLFTLVANGGNMQSWGLRSDSLSSYNALNASYYP
ncbi:MAG: hypothetical protein PHQ65_17295, partial [Bacteroidales bacterium]|nr:hypothetical protein [Bacteroidales bacterium]